jgi:hypothetical protein
VAASRHRGNASLRSGKAEAAPPWGTTFQWKGGSESTPYASEADWVSPGEPYPGDKRGAKVVINDTDHSYGWIRMKNDGQEAQQDWVWKNLTSGNNVAFMDPYLVAWGIDRNEAQAPTRSIFCT